MTNKNTIARKAARRKLSFLEFAADPANVSKACKTMGYSKQQFYEIRINIYTFGSEGLLDNVHGLKNPPTNRVSEAIENIILDYSLNAPMHGSLNVS